MTSRLPIAQRLLVWLTVAWPSVSAVVCVAAPPNQGDESSSKVRIALRLTVRANSEVVDIAEVAELRGGNESLRQQIANLDLEDAPSAGQSHVVTPRQVEFRLRLAGIDPRVVSIQGSTLLLPANGTSVRAESVATKPHDSRTITQLTSHSRITTDADSEMSETERAVLAAANECLKKQLPWPEENIVVQLAQPLPRELRENQHSVSATYSAELRSAGTPVGRVVLRVVRKAAGQRTADVPVQVDVRHFEDVAMATKPIARGHVIALSDLEMGRQDVTLLTGYCTSPEQLVGQKAKRILPAEQVVRVVDVEPVARAVEPVLVKRRDRVKAIARSGVLLVTVAGEAMQDGKLGEVIKVRNADSNSFLYGRVMSATEVEVTE